MGKGGWGGGECGWRRGMEEEGRGGLINYEKHKRRISLENDLKFIILATEIPASHPDRRCIYAV